MNVCLNILIVSQTISVLNDLLMKFPQCSILLLTDFFVPFLVVNDSDQHKFNITQNYQNKYKKQFSNNDFHFLKLQSVEFEWNRSFLIQSTNFSPQTPPPLPPSLYMWIMCMVLLFLICSTEILGKLCHAIKSHLKKIITILATVVIKFCNY